MKTRKRLLALFLSAMLLLSACGGSPAGGETASEGGGASAPGGSQTEGEGAGGGSELSPAMQAVVDSVTAENAQATGVCGPDIVWYFKDGVLVLEGTGPMTDYGYFDSQDHGSPAWYDFADEINMIYVPEGVTTVGHWAFGETTQLSCVSLPSTLELIGENAFQESGLTSIVIPNGITEIPDGMVSDCSQLQEIVIPDSVTKFGDGAFAGCALTSFTIPDGMTEIAPRLFYGCSQLQEVDIPDSVTKIGEYAFAGSGLASVNVPSSVTEIGDYAFDSRALQELTIPASVTSIGTRVISKGRLIFQGDAPAPMREDHDSFYDNFFYYEYDEVTVVYHGEGFEPYIEAAEGHPNIQWVKG